MVDSNSNFAHIRAAMGWSVGYVIVTCPVHTILLNVKMINMLAQTLHSQFCIVIYKQ